MPIEKEGNYKRTARTTGRAVAEVLKTSVSLAALETESLPVEGLVFFVSPQQHLAEDLAHVVVVGLLLEFQSLHVLEVLGQHDRVFVPAPDQLRDVGLLLQSADLSVLFSFGVYLDTLPG